MGSYLIFFVILNLIFHNPILAIIVLGIVYYFVDRRFIGLTPSLTRPFRRQMRISQLRRAIAANPHDAPARYDLARTYLERGRYGDALHLIESLPASQQEAADVRVDWGLCELATGRTEEGEARVRKALEANPSLRRGEPYLQMATLLSDSAPNRALSYLRTFEQYNVSSCESQYRLALLLSKFGDARGARDALYECLRTYSMLPKFRRRVERRWATLARLRLIRSR